MNTKLRAVTDANGRALNFVTIAGQVSDYTCAAALLDELPRRNGRVSAALRPRLSMA